MSKVAFFFDIDATIAHAGRRIAFAGPEPSRDDREAYEAWIRRIMVKLIEDKPVPGMLQIVSALADDINNSVLYLTSREEKWRDITEMWLDKHKFPRWANLHMRGNEDYRDTAEYKAEAIEGLSKAAGATHVVVCDDDEHGTLEAVCKAKGYTFLKARSGGQR